MTDRNREILVKLKASDEGEKLKQLKFILGTDSSGCPNITDGELLYNAWKIALSISEQMEKELMWERFYKNSRERYHSLIYPHMKRIGETKFLMGADADAKIKYCGEEPQHQVILDEFLISDITITQEIYSLYDPSHDSAANKNMPVCFVSWYDAVMFCKWADCRLPTEAEWEWASRGGNIKGYWCCENESVLKEYGWFSENSDGIMHETARLRANGFGLYDMHGNVWEWCADSYDENYYSASPVSNPVNLNDSINKVCRGGSINAFSEMCRCSFRNYETGDLSANDIGFRVAKNVK